MSTPSSESRTPQSANAAAWDALARGNDGLTRPARDEDFADPLGTVDPLGWLGGDIRGKRLLCLAAGGGRHSALYAAAGADVTVLDISAEMLARDRAVATERRLNRGSRCLSMFAAGERCHSPGEHVLRAGRPGGLPGGRPRGAAGSTSASTSRP